jgi:hypothetical protein
MNKGVGILGYTPHASNAEAEISELHTGLRSTIDDRFLCDWLSNGESRAERENTWPLRLLD